MGKQILIAPSILSADFSKIAEEIVDVTGLEGADWIHLDVMDGHFVPNITIGPSVVKSLRSKTDLFFDTHLMIEEPDDFIKDFARSGADLITVHVEACRHLNNTLMSIKGLGIKAGVALNPATPLITIKEVINIVDLVLVMTVNPGFGGQRLIESCLGKIREVAELIKDKAPNVLLEVDGGVKLNNISRVTKRGANIIVAGNAIFKSQNRLRTIRMMRARARA